MGLGWERVLLGSQEPPSPFPAPPYPACRMGFAQFSPRYAVEGNPQIGINFNS